MLILLTAQLPGDLQPGAELRHAVHRGHHGLLYDLPANVSFQSFGYFVTSLRVRLPKLVDLKIRDTILRFSLYFPRSFA